MQTSEQLLNVQFSSHSPVKNSSRLVASAISEREKGTFRSQPVTNPKDAKLNPPTQLT